MKKIIFFIPILSIVLSGCHINKIIYESPTSYSNSSSDIESNTEDETPIDEVDLPLILTPSKRMPAEFEKSAMVKMVYPNNVPLSIYKEISLDNKMLILVNRFASGASRIAQARNAFIDAGVNIDNVTFINMDLDDDYYCWIRDCSPFYVFNDLDLSIVDFTYNRPYRSEQNDVPSHLAEYFNMPYSKMPLTHTGGNLMQDGRGTAFSDDLVIQENSNNRIKVINNMKNYTGTERYVITIDPQGDYIAHIDCWGKIVAPDKIIVAQLPENNPHYADYEKVADILAKTPCSYGYNYRIYRIQEPGGNVIAPYTNSLILNNHVYVPMGENELYNQKALQIYQEALPGYVIKGLEGYPFNEDFCFLNTDALHCRSHEVPDANMMFIDSRNVYNGEVEYAKEYLIQTNIVAYSKEDIPSQNVTISYSINDEEYITDYLLPYKNSTNYIYSFTNLKSGDDVKYYIEASDASNNYAIDPTCGQLDPHHFIVK